MGSAGVVVGGVHDQLCDLLDHALVVPAAGKRIEGVGAGEVAQVHKTDLIALGLQVQFVIGIQLQFGVRNNYALVAADSGIDHETQHARGLARAGGANDEAVGVGSDTALKGKAYVVWAF